MSYRDRIQQLHIWLPQQYEVNNERLAFFRILYGIYWLYLLGVPYLAWLVENPSLVFTPKPFLALVLTMPPGVLVLHIISLATLIALGALLLGWYTYWASVATTLLLIVAQAFIFSFGKIDHTILAVLVPFVLRNTGWGHCYSMDELKQNSKSPADPIQNGDALLDLAILLGFAYWTAGVVKVFGGWLNTDLLAVYAYCTSFAARGDMFLNVQLLHWLPLEYYWLFWKSLDVVTVSFECGFLVAIWYRPWLNGYVPIALFFHLLVGVVFGITFWIHGLVFLVFFPAGARLCLGVQSDVQRLILRRLLIAIGVFSVCWFLYFSISAPTMPTAQFSSPFQLLLSRWTPRPAYYLGMLSNSLILLAWLWGLMIQRKDAIVERQ